MFVRLIVALLMLIGNSRAIDVVSTVPSNVPLTQDADYACDFISLWSATTHSLYPTNEARWSAPVLVSHNEAFSLWSPGDLATSGMEHLAEIGAVAKLIGDIKHPDSSTGSYVMGNPFFLSSRQSTTLPTITLTATTPLVSSVTMMAPSPDWFTGVSTFDTRDMQSQTWYQEFVVETYPFDAGTEQGSSFSQSNIAERPQLPISEITVATVPSTGVFLDPATGTDILPVARWQCVLSTKLGILNDNSDLVNQANELLDPDNSDIPTTTLAPDSSTRTKSDATVSPAPRAGDNTKVCKAHRQACAGDSDCCSNFCAVFAEKSAGFCVEQGTQSNGTNTKGLLVFDVLESAGEYNEANEELNEAPADKNRSKLSQGDGGVQQRIRGGGRK